MLPRRRMVFKCWISYFELQLVSFKTSWNWKYILNFSKMSFKNQTVEWRPPYFNADKSNEFIQFIHLQDPVSNLASNLKTKSNLIWKKSGKKTMTVIKYHHNFH